MTETYYRTGRFNADHSTFGGKVYDYDFNGYTSMKDIADRIESDLKFDRQCRKNRETKKIETRMLNNKKGSEIIIGTN